MVLAYITAGLALAALVLWYDFKSWQSFGTGGTPPTLRGYLKIRRWGLYLLTQRQNLFDISTIPTTGPSYLSSKLPARSGPRPKSTRWTLPQRQHPTPITPTARATLSNLISSFPSSPTDSPYLITGPSKTEGGTRPAIHVHPSIPTINPDAKKIGYEVAHVHPKDNSLHVYVSPRDARMVIEKGWGQRFLVSWLAPSSWIHVYAPRDEGEVEIVRNVVRAAVCFAVGKETKE